MKSKHLRDLAFTILANFTACVACWTVAAQSRCDSPLAVEINQKWGFIDRKGDLVIPPTFDFANDFHNGRALVQADGLWGIIDEKGTWIMRPSVEYPMLHSLDQRILVRSKSAVGFLDENGSPIPGSFEDAYPFSEGIAAVKDGNKWGYIDRTGKLIIPFQFAHIGQFVDGVAQVATNNQIFLINRSGERLFSVPTGMLVNTFSEDVASFQEKATGLFGFIDKTGRVAIEPRFQEAEAFSEGLAKVRLGSCWGFINKKGVLTIEARYPEVDDFKDGLSRVRYDHKWGFIRKDGNWAIQPKFDQASDFECGLAFVELEDSKGFIDTNGNFVFSAKR